MNLKEAERKYLNKTVRHFATGSSFIVYDIIDLGPKEKRRIRALFDCQEEVDNTIFQPVDAGILELETHYTLVSSPLSS